MKKYTASLLEAFDKSMQTLFHEKFPIGVYRPESNTKDKFGYENFEEIEAKIGKLRSLVEKVNEKIGLFTNFYNIVDIIDEWMEDIGSSLDLESQTPINLYSAGLIIGVFVWCTNQKLKTVEKFRLKMNGFTKSLIDAEYISKNEKYMHLKGKKLINTKQLLTSNLGLIAEMALFYRLHLEKQILKVDEITLALMSVAGVNLDIFHAAGGFSSTQWDAWCDKSVQYLNFIKRGILVARPYANALRDSYEESIWFPTLSLSLTLCAWTLINLGIVLT